MVFSSPTFLFLFLPLTLLTYLAMPARWRNSHLLLASVIFYVWGAGAQVFVLLYVSLVSYAGVRMLRSRVSAAGLTAAASPAAELERIERSVSGESDAGAVLVLAPPRPEPPSVQPQVGRGPVAVLIVLLLIPIIVYKYVPTVSAFLGTLGGHGGPTVHWVLPLGISFFTFHAISYVVDACRGDLPPERSLRDYLLYLFLFPHQIAGPIVRFRQIATELKDRRDVTLDNVGYGMTRFAWGLFKKACIADTAGVVADAAFGMAGPDITTSTAWIGALAYTVQIYFDFSGYSDMAIGLAAVFGFRFPENFNAPYTSIGPADFWRRWHMTLSSWFRDYVYIPLGGNRHGAGREYGALLMTFFLTSLWHGAAWTFLVWGGVHSLALLLERLTGLRKRQGWVVFRRALMAVFIVASWVPFRAPTLHEAVEIWQAMAGGSWGPPAPEVLLTLTPWTTIAAGIGVLVFFGPRTRTGFALVHGQPQAFRYLVAVVSAPLLLVVAVLSVLWLDFSPFLYFQF
jgi:alginate O-acetyltransferase complex protein AlgI